MDWAYAEGETLNGAGRVITSLTETGANDCWNGQGIVYRVTEEDYLSMDVSQIAVNDALATYRANLAYRPYMVKNQWPAIVWPGSHTDEAAEYSDVSALVQKAVTEYYTDVILGRKNLDADWDTYMQSLDDMGLGRYLELTQLYITNAG